MVKGSLRSEFNFYLGGPRGAEGSEPVPTLKGWAVLMRERWEGILCGEKCAYKGCRCTEQGMPLVPQRIRAAALSMWYLSWVWKVERWFSCLRRNSTWKGQYLEMRNIWWLQGRLDFWCDEDIDYGCYGLNVSPPQPHSYDEAQIPNGMVLGGRVWGGNWVWMKWWGWSLRDGVLIPLGCCKRTS